MASHHNDDMDDVHFFSKDNPVNIQLYYDPARGFVAIASVNGEQLCEEVSDEAPGDALDDTAEVLMLITQKPKMFNDRICKIGEEAATGPKKNKIKDKDQKKPGSTQVVQLRPKRD